MLRLNTQNPSTRNNKIDGKESKRIYLATPLCMGGCLSRVKGEEQRNDLVFSLDKIDLLHHQIHTILLSNRWIKQSSPQCGPLVSLGILPERFLAHLTQSERVYIINNIFIIRYRWTLINERTFEPNRLARQETGAFQSGRRSGGCNYLCFKTIFWFIVLVSNVIGIHCLK